MTNTRRGRAYWRWLLWHLRRGHFDPYFDLPEDRAIAVQVCVKKLKARN